MEKKVRITLNKKESDKIRKAAQELKIDLDLKYAPFNKFEVLAKDNAEYDEVFRHYKQLSRKEGIFLTDSQIKQRVNEAIKSNFLSYLLEVEITDEVVYIKYFNVKDNGSGVLVKSGNVRYEFQLKNTGKLITKGELSCLEFFVGAEKMECFTKEEFEEAMEVLGEEVSLQVLTAIIALGDTGKNIVDVAKKESLTMNRPNKKNKKNKNKKHKKSPIYVKYTEYKVNVKSGEEIQNLIQREYQRRTESWKVKGHWRTYKSGKKVWIKSQTRKAGNQLDDSVESQQEYVVKA